MSSRARIIAAVAVLAAGCAPDLTSSSLLVRSRALVGIITVDGDPTRSNPAPGESATIEIVFGDPGAKPARTWVLAMCEPQATTFGTPICSSLLGAPAVSSTLDTTPPFDPPSIAFTVPSESELAAETTELLMVASVCSGGVVDTVGIEQWLADLAGGTASGAPPICTDGVGGGELATLRVPIDRDGRVNRQPEIDSVRRGGASFANPAPDDAPSTGCVSLGGSIPVVPVTVQELFFEVIVTDESAETFTEIDDVTGQPVEVTETLQIEYVATAGDMDRTFGFIDPGEETVSDGVGWELPPAGEVPADGLLVRFWFSVRDGRGGVDIVERAVCVVPDVGA